MSQIRNEILDDLHVGERVDRRGVFYVGDESRASKPVRAVDSHGAGSADPLAAGAAESQGRIDLILDPDKRVQHHWPAIVQIDLVAVDMGIATGIRIVAIDFESLHAFRVGRCRPPSARPMRDSVVTRNFEVEEISLAA